MEVKKHKQLSTHDVNPDFDTTPKKHDQRQLQTDVQEMNPQ